MALCSYARYALLVGWGEQSSALAGLEALEEFVAYLSVGFEESLDIVVVGQW
jgi:hypothetical protein